MIKIYKITVLLTFLGIGNAYAQDIDTCRNIDITNQIYDLRNKDGISSKKESLNWDEYDENINENPIPDSIVVETYINDQRYVFGGTEPPLSICVNVELQLKFGLSSNCIYVKNPIYSEKYNIIDWCKLESVDYFSNGIVSYEGYRGVKLDVTFPIKKIIQVELERIGDEMMLNQVIIRTSISSSCKSTDIDCYTEFIHNICGL